MAGEAENAVQPVSLADRVGQAMRPRLRFKGTHTYILPTVAGLITRTDYQWVDQYDRLWYSERNEFRLCVLLGHA